MKVGNIKKRCMNTFAAALPSLKPGQISNAMYLGRGLATFIPLRREGYIIHVKLLPLKN